MPRKRYFFDGRTAHAHFPGIGRYAVNLAKAMAEQLEADEELRVLRDPQRDTLFDGFGSGFVSSSSPRSHVSIHDVPASPFSLKQQWIIPQLLRRERASVYHSPYLLMPLRPGVPTLVTIHDLIPMLFPAESSLKARLLFRLALFAAGKLAQKLIVVSEATRRDLLDAHPWAQSKTTVCLEGAAQGFAPASSELIATVKAKYKIPGAYALYVGSNKPHKNLSALVRIWQESEQTSCDLVIAGVSIPGYSVPLASRTRHIGRVDDADLAALYSGAELFIFPSLYEGFGLPVLEAMACGAPVACSGRSSLPELGGDAAVYFDPEDPRSMREVIFGLLDRREILASMRTKSVAQAKCFSWSKAAKETLHLYRELSG